jgi:hypothetical protein
MSVREHGVTARIVAVGAVAACLALAGCASSSNTASKDAGAARNATSGSTPQRPAVGGWDCPGGTCTWEGGDERSTAASGESRSLDAAVDTAAAPTTAVPPSKGALPTTDGPASPTAQGPVTAGSIDDNAAWNEYLRYRQSFDATGLPHEKIPVEGRQIIKVVDASGDQPVLGADIDVRDARGAQVAHLRTYADGRALFHPIGIPDPSSQNLPTYTATITKGSATATLSITPGQPSFTVALDQRLVPGPTQLDVLFLLDATGSMGDEIARLKANIASVAQQIDALPSRPDVHFALTAYRDRHDSFVTRTFDFTADEAQFAKALDEVQADGGGDTPEDLDAGLDAAINRANWRGPDAVKLVFLVADAPPHVDYPDAPPYAASLAAASAAGIKVLPIGASGLDPSGAYIFRQLAQYTLGRFVFLTYGADGASPGTSTPHVAPDRYSVLPLDQLIVQLVADELPR